MSAPQPGHAWTAGDTVLWPNGVEGKVCGVDFDDRALMDHCGGWHDMADVDLLEAGQ